MLNLPEARIGCVRYLNSKPLIHGHGGEVSFEVPASLADGLHSGRLDVALSPTFELMAHPGYLVVDDVAIASRGAVFSVFVAYAGELRDLRTLYLDGDSRTSFNLQRVLLAEFHGLTPSLVPLPGGQPPDSLREGEGALVIGDPAIEFRLRHGDAYRYFDLGEEWGKATGLPFVFAAWLVRADFPEPERLGGTAARVAGGGAGAGGGDRRRGDAVPGSGEPKVSDGVYPVRAGGGGETGRAAVRAVVEKARGRGGGGGVRGAEVGVGKWQKVEG